MINGGDTNPQEVTGVFTALERLKTALQNNDVTAINRAASLLDTAETNTNYARAELGAHEQTLTTVLGSLQTQATELKSGTFPGGRRRFAQRHFRFSWKAGRLSGGAAG